MLWDRAYGGADLDQLQGVVSLDDSGFVFGGWSRSRAGFEKSENNRGETDFWLIATDTLGNPLWNRTYGGNLRDELAILVKASNGELVAGGISNSEGSTTLGERQEYNRGGFDYWMLRLDSTGTLLWEFAAGGPNDDFLHVIVPSRDGGFFVGGWSNSNVAEDKSEASRGDFDYWVVKVDSNGRKVWDRTYGGRLRDELRAIVELDNGDLVIVGNSESPAGGDRTARSFGDADFWVLLTDSLGTIKWDRAYGGNLGDRPRSALLTPEGNILIAGFSNSGATGSKTDRSRGGDDFWLIEIDTLGAIRWDRTYGGDGEDQCWSLTPAYEGGYLLAGWSRSGATGERTSPNQGGSRRGPDYWVVKVDETGRLLWERAFGGANDDFTKYLLPVKEGRYLVPGFSSSGVSGDRTDNNRGTSYDYWVVMFRDSTIIPTNRTIPLGTAHPFLIYPNPSTDYVTIQISGNLPSSVQIVDVVGRERLRETSIEHDFRIDVSALPAGVYMIVAEYESGSRASQRLVLTR